MRFTGAATVAMLALVGLNGVARAADMPVKARVAAPANVVAAKNWTGFYVGVFGGYHNGTITQSGCVGLCAVDPTLKGGLFGFQAGYDYQFNNNVVVGVFGWLPVTRPKGTTSIGPGLDFHVNPTSAWVAAARLGYAYDRFLPYVFAGVGYTKVDVHSDVTNITSSNSYRGPVLGLGVEYAITNNITLDLRYMYSTVPMKTYDFGGGPEDYGERASNFLASINYRF